MASGASHSLYLVAGFILPWIFLALGGWIGAKIGGRIADRFQHDEVTGQVVGGFVGALVGGGGVVAIMSLF